MQQYLRIPKNKFWAWVWTSLAIGAILGAGAAWVFSTASTSKQVSDLKKQLASQASAAASSATALQSRLDSAEASLTTVSQQYAQLQQQASSTTAKPASSSTTSSTATLEVISRTVSPSTVATGDPITLTARVQGPADKVTMRIISVSSGAATTYSLKKSSTSGDISRWVRTVAAPKTKGTYRYYATAYEGDNSATMPGAKASTFTVK